MSIYIVLFLTLIIFCLIVIHIEKNWPSDLLTAPVPSEAESAVRYAQRMGHRYPAKEHVIMKDPKWAFWYAKTVVKGPWSAGEKAMASDIDWAIPYLNEVISTDNIAHYRFVKLC